MEFIKTFGLPIIMFIVLAWASLDTLACGTEQDEADEMPTFLFIK